jgi:beta-galactosidase
LVSAELYGRHLDAGSSAMRRVCIANDAEDGRDLPAGVLVWELRAGGKVLASGSQATPAVPYYNNQWVNVNFTMPAALPAPRTDAVLFLKLQAGGRVVSENNYDVLVATKDWASVKINAQLYDPSGRSKEVTEDLRLTKVNSLSSLNPALPLVVGDADAVLKESGGVAKLKSYVASGGNVLLLQPGKTLTELFPEQVKSYRKTEGEIAVMAVPESPVFDGIEPLDTAWFEMGAGRLPSACGGTYEMNRDDPGVTVLALQCDIHPEIPKKGFFTDAGAPLVQIGIGKGRVLASEMMLSAKGSDPIAGRLLGNMLRYLGSKNAGNSK